jgi:hypothetical protein
MIGDLAITDGELERIGIKQMGLRKAILSSISTQMNERETLPKRVGQDKKLNQPFDSGSSLAANLSWLQKNEYSDMHKLCHKELVAGELMLLFGGWTEAIKIAFSLENDNDDNTNVMMNGESVRFTSTPTIDGILEWYDDKKKFLWTDIQKSKFILLEKLPQSFVLLLNMFWKLRCKPAHSTTFNFKWVFNETEPDSLSLRYNSQIVATYNGNGSTGQQNFCFMNSQIKFGVTFKNNNAIGHILLGNCKALRKLMRDITQYLGDKKEFWMEDNYSIGTSEI